MNRFESEVISLFHEIQQGKRGRFPNHYFAGDQGKQLLITLTRYIIEKHLNIPMEEIPQKITADLLWKNRLKPPAALHGLNFMELIELVYPNQFFPWEFKQVSYGYWMGEEGRERATKTVKYVVEEIEKIPIADLPQRINTDFFKRNRLISIMDMFGSSPYQVVEAIYPGLFQPWQFANVPLNCWKNATFIKQSMDQLLFHDLKFQNYQEALTKIKKEHFFEYRRSGLFIRAFRSSLQSVRKWISQQMACASGVN
ncbi:hypothetical protein BK138_34320 [Paenibacillus rhizosphaerae]|uniref:DUF4046 domain-containing protein n=1 Tax=Paenibacillus rhizosphaerae TaxID=297318 RepID=A0A1R1DYU2_9BACL|nr:hypothetical protein [Paenibacillus rhizosphaerae]OMF44725.1 hypothetical protein BK138_34320 [Paenibacillus rhizosphaerae]